MDEPGPAGFPAPSAGAQTRFPSSQDRDTRWLARHWQEARLRAEQRRRGYVLAFDEIQKIPRWSETVKGLWDADHARDCPLRIVILGLSPLLMQSGLSESLAGRFETIPVAYWSFREIPWEEQRQMGGG